MKTVNIGFGDLLNHMNKIKIDKQLKNLASIFKNNNKLLFLVGGYVRDFFIKSEIGIDVDICSNCKLEELKTLLNGTKFILKNINKKTGTCKIFIDNFIYEYATFRKDFYNYNGSHKPLKVEFLDNEKEDFLRRDFTCNSVYYNLISNEIFDPVNGLSDIKNKILKTVRNPEIVFAEDCERILRMIRLHLKYDFKIDEKTLYYAKQNVDKLKNLEKNRVEREVNKIKELKHENLKNVIKDFNIEFLFKDKEI